MARQKIEMCDLDRCTIEIHDSESGKIVKVIVAEACLEIATTHSDCNITVRERKQIINKPPYTMLIVED